MAAIETNAKVVLPQRIYSDEELGLIDRSKVPEHVAIIMDGNRRWARKNGLSPILGHWEGCEVLTQVVRAASELGVKVLTVFAFSTENWKRSEEEVRALMDIFEIYLDKKRLSMQQEGVRLELIGDLSRCTEGVRRSFAKTSEATADCCKIELVLAINYGGRDEIKRAFGKILEDYDKKKIAKERIDEDLISRYLDTARWKDPDLLIRTSGEMRLSNFLLWQISYSEVYVSDVLWPDFSKLDFLDAVLSYQKRNRRLGGD